MTPSTSTTSSSLGSDDTPSGVPSSVSGPVVDRLARTAHSAVDRVADGASSAVGRVRSGVSDALSTVSDKVQGLSSSRDEWMDSSRQQVRDHPFAAVGIGLAAGFLIARLLRD